MSIYKNVSKLNRAVNDLERERSRPKDRLEYWEAVPYGAQHRIFAGGESPKICITPITLPVAISVHRIKMLVHGNNSTFNCAIYRLMATRRHENEQTWRKMSEATPAFAPVESVTPLRFDLNPAIELPPVLGLYAVAWYASTNNAEFHAHPGPEDWFASFETGQPPGPFPEYLQADGRTRRTPSMIFYSDLGVRATGG